MLNRRTLLQSTAMAMLGLASGCSFKPQPEEVPLLPRRNRLGQGAFSYQLDKNWGKANLEQYPIMHCQEMVIDDMERIYLLNTDPRNNIIVYNRDGKILNNWTHQLRQAHGLSIAGTGSDQHLWITDCADGRVLQVALDGRVMRDLKLPAGVLPPGQYFRPTETALAPNGDLYVADGYGSNLIWRYDRQGRLQDWFGGPEHFDCAHGIAVDLRTPEPSLLITSQNGNNFQRWSLDGTHLHTYHLPGLYLCRPVIRGDYTYFAVLCTHSPYNYDGMLAILDADMRVVSLPGSEILPIDGDFSKVVYDDTFLNPHDVCVDSDGNLYVPQTQAGRTYPIRLKRS